MGVIALAIEYYMRQLPNDYKNKKSYIDQEGNLIHTLILGNSHTMYACNPTYFTKPTYNFAFLSQSLEMDRLLLYRYGNQFSSLQTVIVPISYFSLFSDMKRDGCEHLIKNYCLYLDIDYKFRLRYHAEILNENPYTLLYAFYKHRKLDSEHLLCDSLGWAKKTGSRKGKSIATWSAEAVKRHSFSDTGYVALNRAQLNLMQAYTQQHQIQLILISTPVHPTYFASIEKSKQYRYMQEVIKQCCEASQTPYIQCMQDKRYSDDDFYDGDHLNEKGAKKLSVYLDSVIQHTALMQK